jgi:acyl-CoA thioesterase I
VIEPATSDAVRVACVGDSITRGTFVWRRKKNAYPAQLQVMLGERFCVRGFGANGHAVQRSADRPYWNSGAFSASIAFRPDIVLIMLGTNDSRGDNWKGVDSFARDYRELVQHYRSLESNPAVWLLTPSGTVPARAEHEGPLRHGSTGALREMCGAIEGLAHDLGCGLIDVNGATAGHPEAFRFDGVHPGAAGATLIARAASEALAS